MALTVPEYVVPLVTLFTVATLVVDEASPVQVYVAPGKDVAVKVILPPSQGAALALTVITGVVSAV